MISKLRAARHAALHDVRGLLHLPLVSRLLHHKARKVVSRFVVGVVVMLSGAFVAHEKHAIAEMVHIHELFVDTLGYAVHGTGLIPILRYIEPIFVLMFGED